MFFVKNKMDYFRILTWEEALTDVQAVNFRGEQRNLLKSLVPLEEEQEINGSIVFVRRELGEETDIEEKVKKLDIQYLTETYERLKSKLSFRKSIHEIEWINDVQSLDVLFLKRRFPTYKTTTDSIEIKCLLYGTEDINSGNNTVLGQVWYFTKKENPHHCAIYGIKSNIINLLGGNRGKGIAVKMLEKLIYPLAKQEKRSKLVIPWPLPPMVKILEKLDFMRHDEGNTPEMEFLRGITLTTNYYTKDIDKT
jgi:hypothetical protein